MKEFKIALRSLLYGKKFTAILAIALCTLLFTTLITTFFNVTSSFRESRFRFIGTDCHMSAKGITPEEFDTLLRDSRIESGGFSITVGRIRDDVTRDMRTEVRYTDEYHAKHSFQFPSEGRMPQNQVEIALSSNLLTAYGKKVGDSILLDIETEASLISGEFVIVGSWKSDNVMNLESAWLAKDWLETHGVIAEDNQKLACLFMLGVGQSDVPHAYDELVSAYPSMELSLNPVYKEMADSVSSLNLLPLAASAFVIFVSAFLIIYNVFNIAVVKETREYGMLKAIGCTNRQIGRIVNFKVLTLCLVGIPLGLLAGLGIGWLLLPYVSAIFQAGHQAYSVHPYALLLAVAFSMITVFISTRKSMKTAKYVSPIEAMNYIGFEGDLADRKSEQISPLSLAKVNIKRAKKRFCITIVSIALGLLVLNMVASVIFSFSFEKFIGERICGDFGLKGKANDASNGNPVYAEVSHDLMQVLNQSFGIQSAGEVYYTMQNLRMPDEKVKSATAFMQKYSGRDLGYSYEADALEFEVYGVSESLLRQAKVFGEGEPTVRPGEAYLVHSSTVPDDAIPYKVGDAIQIGAGEQNKMLQIVGYVTLPATIHVDRYTAGTVEVLISEADFKAVNPSATPTIRYFNAAQEKHSEIQDFLEKELSHSYHLELMSRIYLQKEFAELLNMMEIVGGATVALLLLIGILNYVSSVCTSILMRINELSVLEAIGTTKAQCKKMLIFEGLIYVAYSGALALAFGVVTELLVVEPLSHELAFLNHSFSILPILIAIIPIAAITCLIPVLYYLRNRKSIIESISRSM